MSGRRAVVTAAVIVALLVAWVGSNIERVDVPIPAALTGQALVDPFYAAVKVMRELGATATSDRVLTLPEKDGVLLLSGWRWGLNDARAAIVRRWVESGGRLVVDDTVLVDGAFQDWSGLKPAAWTSLEGDLPRRVSGCRNLEEPDAQGGNAVRFAFCTPLAFGGITASRPADWRLADPLGAQAVRVRVGGGRVTAINGDTFKGRQILDGDHAALLVTAAQLRAGDEVHFLSESAYPSILTLAWRSGGPVIVLLLLGVALWVWRSVLRFGPTVAPEPAARRSLEEQIRGTGEFTRRYGAARPLLAASLRALDRQAARRIPGYARLTGDARLHALSRATGVSTGALADAMVSGGDGAPIANALATLETARRALMGRTQKD